MDLGQAQFQAKKGGYQEDDLLPLAGNAQRTLPPPPNMQRQIHHHTRGDGAQDAAPDNEKEGCAHRGGQAGIHPGGQQLTLVHEDFRGNHGSQRSQGGVFQAPLEPVGHGQLFFGNEKECPGQQGNGRQPHGSQPAKEVLAQH